MKDRDPLGADMAEFYGVNLFSIGLDDGCSDDDALYIAILLGQLPPSARCVTKEDPDASWSTDAWLLRQIEFDIRALMYGLSGRKGAKPDPIEIPSETLRKQRVLEFAESEADEVYEILRDILPKNE